ncbi:MAG TPA: CpsB/CapC family capsule biosynthesis tyrosine phosphatase [Blastocatellia bacterium]|nr:CpsB/CapC family capsule biosynthesis tyrosine phosphatase [Blastocatellia bacterium]
MIDIHSHILPEVDDGSRSLDESIEMCRISAEDGVKVVVATPHAHDHIHATHDTALLRQKVLELNEKLCGNPRVELGCELRFTHDVVRQICVDRTAPTIAGGPYALIEFPHSVVPAGSHRALFELMSHKIRPIIAHPERNHSLMAEPERFYEMVEMGALGQADTGSFTGQFGKKVQQAAGIMLDNGLLHFLASDCHNTRNRLPGLSAAVQIVAARAGCQYATAMVEANPQAVIEGSAIPARPDATRPVKRRRWLIF